MENKQNQPLNGSRLAKSQTSLLLSVWLARVAWRCWEWGSHLCRSIPLHAADLHLALSSQGFSLPAASTALAGPVRAGGAWLNEPLLTMGTLSFHPCENVIGDWCQQLCRAPDTICVEQVSGVLVHYDAGHRGKTINYWTCIRVRRPSKLEISLISCYLTGVSGTQEIFTWF